MMSLKFDQRPVIDDRCIDMEYGNGHLQNSPQSDLFDNEARPRLHTWPASAFFGHQYNTPLYEDGEASLLEAQSRPASRSIPNGGEKRAKKAHSPSKSPPGQQSPKAPQPRRKLTTHKLSAKSYVDLITEAIMSTPERRMTLADIYKWMVANVPCFKQQANVSASSGWKNAVRHTLSLHKRFKRVQRGRLQKPAWWTIQEQEGGANGIISTVAGRAPATEYNYQRRHSEGCFDNLKHDLYTPASSYSNVDMRGPCGAGFYEHANSEWASSNGDASGTTVVPATGVYGSFTGNPWDMGTYDQVSPAPTAPPAIVPMRSSSGNIVTGEDEDGADSGIESYVANGGNYLTRTTSDASSYGSSPYRAKALTQAYSSIEHEEEYKPVTKTYEQLQGYNLSETEEYGQLVYSSPVIDSQTVMVKTEKGAVAHISVPMPLRIDVRQQADQQAQTMAYLNNANYTHTKPYFPSEMFGLPQDLLSVQVDSQVQCNVAEVLAYEMKASTVTEQNEVNDLYDLLKAGCALD